MRDPLVSVVIPVHNGVRHLIPAVESVLLQRVPLEIIVVDDASDEDVAGALAEYIDSGRLILLRNEKNLGPARSRNRGVKKAKGRFIAYLDSDDSWEPDKLRKQLREMKRTGCVLCSTGRRLMTPEGRKTRRTIGVRQRISYRGLLTHNSINCSSVVMRRDVALEFPMAHDEYHEDYLTWLRVLRKYRYACAVNEPLLNYRLSNKGKSGNKLHSARMTYGVYRCMGFSLPKSILCFISYSVNGLLKYSDLPLKL